MQKPVEGFFKNMLSGTEKTSFVTRRSDIRCETLFLDGPERHRLGPSFSSV